MGNQYRIEITTKDDALDSEGRGVLHDFHEYGLTEVEAVRALRVFTLGGDFDAQAADTIAREFLADAVVDRYAVNEHVLPEAVGSTHAVEIVRKQGVMDPVETSVRKGILELGYTPDWVRNTKKYIITGAVDEGVLEEAAYKILANAVIEEVAVGHDIQVSAPASKPYEFQRTEVPLSGLSADELMQLSQQGQLYLSLVEMLTIQAYYEKAGRNPTDIELETLAQTWSEHCVHKTLKGRIRYTDLTTGEEIEIDNLLKSTIAKVTHDLDKEWCWSVFEDNAGVIDFDGTMGAVFKVETHNHPSAIEPYGGAGTGLGGCIRDPLGTGLGARPVMNTDIFCFGPPDLPREKVPKGALHPLRVLKGVVAGVRDYGNRMGIPTGNGAVYFDERYIGNPLVFCGVAALVPKEMAKKRSPKPGQLGIVVGGRTGRDGIHGATFSSVELDEDSEMVSSGAVQIGNAIEEKKVHDFLLRARDAGLYTAITDCGAGGLSSALGEMGESCGVEVDLEKVPLKYDGLSYTEIWISEAQERMVIAADDDQLEALQALAKEENVEITAIARFRDDQHLVLRYNGAEVGRMAMDFLHEGCPRIEREAVWNPPIHERPSLPAQVTFTDDLKAILGAWNVCSKEWIIRQYDHEVQGNSVVKPLVGATHDGPGDAAVIAPIPGSPRGLVLACGLNPKYSDVDPYLMAASAIDEALRNVVAVGGTIDRCAILDNFCWGKTDKPDRLAGLVRAALACRDVGTAYGVPFISGKDSLNNEFGTGENTICIPGTLLISAMSVMEDVSKALTMDAKRAGNALYLVGLTRKELGGSHWYALRGAVGQGAPTVDTDLGKRVFAAMGAANQAGLLASAHDCSEGGLAVAAAEMAFAGGLGMALEMLPVQQNASRGLATDEVGSLLFSESNHRFVIEVAPENAERLEATLTEHEAPFARLGEVTDGDRFVIRHSDAVVVDAALDELKTAWRRPLALG